MTSFPKSSESQPGFDTATEQGNEFEQISSLEDTIVGEGTVNPRKLMIFRPHMAEGGADRVTVTLLNHLDRSLFQPTLVLMRREGVLLSEIPPDVPVIDLGAWRLRSAWVSLARLLREAPPDILLSMSSGGNPVASLAHFLARSRSRLVLSRRNILNARELGSITGRLFRPLHGRLYRRADAVVAISKGVAEDLVSILHVPQAIVSVIYNPLPEELIGEVRSQPPPHPWFEDSIPVLLAVGRLVEQKDYPTLLRAFALIRKRHPSRLLILGVGPLQSKLQGLCNELGLQSDVRFAGWVSDPSAYMRWCTVFILSSQWEGLCTALLEALGCGAAAVSTNCRAGPSELIVDGENGFLVPVGDAEEMANAVVTLLEDTSLRDRLRVNARASARRFLAPGIISLYEDALLGVGQE